MDFRSRWERYAIAVLIGAPVASLLLSGVAWLMYGIDLPFYDDFRAYARRTALSLDPRDLFTPSNDTLYPVGMALDVLAQRFLKGNAIAYQLISMMVLMGGLLALQWRLLASTLQDRLIAAAAFASCLFLTWPESYWGLQNMAYHHGLPILFLLGALTAVVERRWTSSWGVPLVFVLGLLAGFSYISGAVASLAMAAVLLLARAAGAAHPHGLRAGAFALLAAAAITVPAQLWGILFFQHGRIHDPTATWSLPTESGFWMFLLGKVGRGLALPYDRPVFSLIVTLAAAALTVGIAAYLLRRVWRERGALPEETSRITLVFFSLAAAVASYLSLIAAGRANLMAPSTRTPLNMFIHGLPEHYHSVWVTLLFPWLAAAAAVAARRWIEMPRIRRSPVIALAAVAVVAAAAQAGAFSHHTHFRNIETFRLRTDVPCVRKAVEEGVVACPEWYTPDLIDVLRYGRQIGASFVRYFPLKPVPLGTDAPPPLFRLSDNPETLDRSGLTPTAAEEGLVFAARHDIKLIIGLPSGSLRSCWELEVNLEIKAQHDDIAELFVLPHGQGGFREPSASQAHVRSTFSVLTLSALSLTGFEDRVRIDPVGEPQSFTVRDLEIRCRGNVPAQGG